MTTLDDLMVRLLHGVEEKLAFKEAALRYCNHSKKRAKLWKEVQGLRELAALYRKYLDEEDDE